MRGVTQRIADWQNLAEATKYRPGALPLLLGVSLRQLQRHSTRKMGGSPRQWLAARENAAFFQRAGIAEDSPARWTTANTSYSDGWALGRLVHVPGTNIVAAFGSGQLTGFDILVTDRLPVEVPYVAEIIVFGPATPNSHVAIMSRSFALDFEYKKDRTDGLTIKQVRPLPQPPVVPPPVI